MAAVPPGADDIDDDELLAALPVSLRQANAVPDALTASRRQQAARIATDLLADVTVPNGLVTSPLGHAWATDVDVYVRVMPPPERLTAAGWIPLDSLLRRIGSAASGRWAVTVHGEVIGAIDLCLGPVVEPVQRVLRRCLRRGEVRIREVLELRALARCGLLKGVSFPVLAVAADVEAALGGRTLREWDVLDVRAAPPVPVPRPPRDRVRRRVKPLREALRPRLVIALSGVDGAGKSTLNARLRDQLAAAGVPAATVWARPGNHLDRLEAVARVGKRLLRREATPGIERRAAGDVGPRSQHSLIESGWTVTISAAYLANAWRQHLQAHGVVIWDRHVLDALATLDFGYSGPSLRWIKPMVVRLLPAAQLTFYLEVPVETAVARKPQDVLGEHAVAAQLDSYRQQLAAAHHVEVLDTTLPVEQNAREVLNTVIASCA